MDGSQGVATHERPPQQGEGWRGVQPVSEPVTLPERFQHRVRALSHNTALHVPLSLRLRMLRITRQCWNRFADG
eukprot:1003408-Lingulodinium_polyedra.AAC.1